MAFARNVSGQGHKTCSTKSESVNSGLYTLQNYHGILRPLPINLSRGSFFKPPEFGCHVICFSHSSKLIGEFQFSDTLYALEF